MSIANIAAKLKSLTLQPTAARTTTAAGTALDLLGYEGVGKLVLDCAAGTGTSPSLDVGIQESDNGTTGWVDVDMVVNSAEAVQFNNIGAVASVQERHIDVSARKRFLRELHTISGTTPSFAYSLKLIAQKKYD